MFKKFSTHTLRNLKCIGRSTITNNNTTTLSNKSSITSSKFLPIQSIFNQQQQQHYATAPGQEKGTIAVILSGCGYLDGTEITEAVSVMVHLSRKEYKVAFFAPDINQEETFDHTTKNIEKNEVRNIRTEAARITRQNVLKMEQFRPQAFDGLVIPGGFGVAKNLSDYANNPSNPTIEPEVKKAILSAFEAKKPMAMCCIAPILAARLIPECQVTIGDSDPTHNTNVESYGSHAVTKSVGEVLVDKTNRLVTTPAYMGKNPAPYEVYDGIGQMIDSFLQLTGTQGDESGEVNFGVLEELAIKQLGEKEWKKLKDNTYGANAKAESKITLQDIEKMEL